MNASDQVVIPNQYADSDSRVKAKHLGQFRIASEDGATIHDMGEAKSKDAEPVSEFIRELIGRWEGEGKFLKDLASAAGLAKSMPSQIKARTSDATLYSATKLARPLGYVDLPDLVNAAYAWWHSSDRTVIPESSTDAPRAEAIRLAEKYGVTQEQVGRVLSRWPLDDYGDKDTLWWLSRFHEERTLDAEKAAKSRGERSAEASEQRAVKRQQSEIRQVNEAAKAQKAAARNRAMRRTRRAS